MTNGETISFTLELSSRTAGVEPASGMKRSEEFWQMIVPFKHKLYQYIFKSLGFADESQDVFQETLFRAFMYLDKFRCESSFQTWVFAIAHNEIRRHFRSMRRSPVRLTDEEWNRQAGLTGEDSQAKILYELALGLPLRQREVFFLFYNQGFSIHEIHSITGLSVGNIKFILHEARNAVRDLIGGGHD